MKEKICFLIRGSRAVVSKLFESGPGFRFFGPLRARAREKNLHCESISNFAIFSPKIVVVSKKKRFSLRFDV